MTLYNCDKCNKPIGLNEAYIAITYNVEMLNHNPTTMKDEINVRHSEPVLILCGKCGNTHYAGNIADALKLKESVYQQVEQEEIKEVQPRDTNIKLTKSKDNE